jgi:hypothetical protein
LIVSTDFCADDPLARITRNSYANAPLRNVSFLNFDSDRKGIIHTYEA